MSLKTYLIIAALVGGFLLAAIVKHEIDQYHKTKAENLTLKTENKEVKNVAKNLLSRPRTDCDIVHRLHDAADKAAKLEGKPKQRLSLRCDQGVR